MLLPDVIVAAETVKVETVGAAVPEGLELLPFPPQLDMNVKTNRTIQLVKRYTGKFRRDRLAEM